MEANEPTLLYDEIKAIHQELHRVTSFILELSTSDVLRLLGISKASLARWRETNSIPYRYLSSNHVVYPFKGLYLAVKTGRATFKGFRRLEALQRLNAYKDGIIKGYMGDHEKHIEDL